MEHSLYSCKDEAHFMGLLVRSSLPDLFSGFPEKQYNKKTASPRSSLPFLLVLGTWTTDEQNRSTDSFLPGNSSSAETPQPLWSWGAALGYGAHRRGAAVMGPELGSLQASAEPVVLPWIRRSLCSLSFTRFNNRICLRAGLCVRCDPGFCLVLWKDSVCVLCTPWAPWPHAPNGRWGRASLLLALTRLPCVHTILELLRHCQTQAGCSRHGVQASCGTAIHGSDVAPSLLPRAKRASRLTNCKWVGWYLVGSSKNSEKTFQTLQETFGRQKGSHPRRHYCQAAGEGMELQVGGIQIPSFSFWSWRKWKDLFQRIHIYPPWPSVNLLAPFQSGCLKKQGLS